VSIGSAKIITEGSLIPENRQTPFPILGREFSLLSFPCFVVLGAWEDENSSDEELVEYFMKAGNLHYTHRGAAKPMHTKR